jgi:hypothetical protein
MGEMREIRPKRTLGARRFAAIALGATVLGSGLAGCASSRYDAQSRYAHMTRSNSAAAALPTPGVYRYGPVSGAGMYGSNVGAEAVRRNDDLSYRRPLPFNATRQWPEPLPPREDPVRFERWRQ